MSQHYDVVVVGGGINGTGVAQAAAAAGHKVMLLEKTCLAAGTSSKSSKLIHGGLRYLESYEFSLVRESLHERALMLKLAPELVQIRPFCIPVFAGMRRGPFIIRAGLSLYATLAKWNRNARFKSLRRSQWENLDGLRTDNLRAVFRYHDAQTNDALLTQAVMRSAQSLGAELEMPATFVGAQLGDDGVNIDFLRGDTPVSCTAKVLVNAGGPWISRVMAKVSPKQSARSVELIRGSHILLPGKIEQGMYYLESRRDGRAVFVMPWEGSTLVGTTETRYKDDPDDVAPLPTERSYLLGILQYYFPRFRTLGLQDIESEFAGLRVLPGGTGHAFHRSREVIFDVDKQRHPRMVSIYGGKLTTWRVTAQKTLERIASSLPEREPVADTAELELTPE